MENCRLCIRGMVENDCAMISAAFAAQGWCKPEAQYQDYWQASLVGKRVVLCAECQGQLAGYVTILWESDYPPFHAAHIPEIADLNVLIRHQRRGIGAALLGEAERRIAVVAPRAGVGVGVTSDYGAAQRLYARRGYVPDGQGIYQAGRWVRRGDTVIVDDDLTLYLIKVLRDKAVGHHTSRA